MTPPISVPIETRDLGRTGEDPSALIVVRLRGTLALEKERASHCVDGPGDNDHGGLPKGAETSKRRHVLGSAPFCRQIAEELEL